MKKLVDLYCDVDDFCKVFIPQWQKQLLEDGTRKRQRECRMTMSEILIIFISFHIPIIVILKITMWAIYLVSIKKTFPTFLAIHDFLR